MRFSCIAAPYNRFANKVTSQDLLKAMAMLTMIIDHIGMCFFPKLAFLRAIGRSSAIIWFFFCGYNYRKNLLKSIFFDQLFWLASLFSFIRYFIDGHILYLNVLFAIIVSRLFLDFYSKIKDKYNFIWSCLWFVFLILFSSVNIIIEYGSLGILCSIWGYNHKNKLGNLNYQAFSILCFYIIGWITKFGGYSQIVFLLSVSIAIFLLARFTPKIYEIKGISKYVINISSRYSLYIYVVHLLLFLFIQKVLL